MRDDCTNKPYVKPPKGWLCKKSEGPGPFVTHATFKNPEGNVINWNSRHHRKHHFKLDKSLGTTLWAPGAIGWWIGILFAIGATFFALGAVPSYINLVSNAVNGETFFIGSLFFTVAAFLQYLETTNTPINLGVNIKERLNLITWEPGRVDWWSTVVQFGGTLFFNISTLAALQSSLLINQINRLVWSPDVYGSICFLIASYLAWSEVGHAFWSFKPDNLPWWIAALNIIGSVAFGVSAVASFVLPSTGIPVNLTLTNLGTFTGAICFLIGAILLLPERTLIKEAN